MYLLCASNPGSFRHLVGKRVWIPLVPNDSDHAINWQYLLWTQCWLLPLGCPQTKIFSFSYVLGSNHGPIDNPGQQLFIHWIFLHGKTLFLETQQTLTTGHREIINCKLTRKHSPFWVVLIMLEGAMQASREDINNFTLHWNLHDWY